MYHATIAIGSGHYLHFQGQTVTIGLEIRQSQPFQARSLIDVDNVPTISLYDPYNILLLDQGEMARLSLGRYIYNWQTLSTHNTGLWTADFATGQVDNQAVLENVGVFLLKAGTAARTYTVFLIKDQLNIVWYWYIDRAHQAVSAQPPLPTFLRVPDIINIDLIPSWVRFVNQEGNTRYMYPLITGEYYIDIAPPPLGFEWVDSPIFTAVDGQTFILSGDILDQLLVVPTVVTVAA